MNVIVHVGHALQSLPQCYVQIGQLFTTGILISNTPRRNTHALLHSALSHTSKFGHFMKYMYLLSQGRIQVGQTLPVLEMMF